MISLQTGFVEMLASVGFDDQTLSGTVEIQDVRTELMLPSKLDAGEFLVSEQCPKYSLCRCCLAPKSANRS